LESLGGRYVQDPEADYWLFEVGEFLVELEPFESPFSGGVTIGVESSVSHTEVSTICNRILGAQPEERQTMLWWQNRHDLKEGERPCPTLTRLIEDALGRVSRVDLALQVRELAATCPDGPSMRQVLHLAALAYQGDFPRLLDYVKTFERGKRLNFVPMISSDMLSRAFDVAVERGAK
jgi:hypothetical protein